MQLFKEIGCSGELTTPTVFVVLNHYTDRFYTAPTVLFALQLLAGIGDEAILARDGDGGVQWSDTNIEILDLRYDVVFHLSEFLDMYDHRRCVIHDSLYEAIQAKGGTNDECDCGC